MISLHEGLGSRRKPKPAEHVYQLHLQVVGCRPAIWRRIQVRDSMWLGRLHDSIQVVFDWFDYQTHDFNFDGVRYGNPLKREGFSVEDDRDITLADLDVEHRGHFAYGYHFGEGWLVDIQVEGEARLVEKGVIYPRCLAGERAGPPEDCGGLDAFHDMLACIEEPHTELGREWLEWLGPEYAAERCHLPAINKALAKLRK